MKDRFCKKTVATWLFNQSEYLRKEHKFDTSTGYAQVERRGEAINRAYAEYAHARNMLDYFDLWEHIDHQPRHPKS